MSNHISKIKSNSGSIDANVVDDTSLKTYKNVTGPGILDDADNAENNSIYLISTSTDVSNLPDSVAGILYTVGWSSNSYTTQFFTPVKENQVYMRTCSRGSWTAWSSVSFATAINHYNHYALDLNNLKNNTVCLITTIDGVTNIPGINIGNKHIIEPGIVYTLGYSNAYLSQIYVEILRNNKRIYIRYKANVDGNAEWTDWRRITEPVVRETELNPTWVYGKFVDNSGSLRENRGYTMTDPISLKQGDVVEFVCRIADPRSVSVIAKKVNESYINVFEMPREYTSNNLTTVVYTVESDGDYVFSTHNVINDVMIKKITGYTHDMKPDDWCTPALFPRFGVVGDSYASGVVYPSTDSVHKYDISWPQIMARLLGTTGTNYSKGGLTTRSWLTNSEGLIKLNNSDPDDIYYMVLGINDYYHLGINYLGTIDDITSHKSSDDYPDTFFGNYGKIIEKIREHAPNSKMIMFTAANNTSGSAARSFNNAIVSIANHYGIPVLYQYNDEFFTSSWYKQGMKSGHPRAVVYSGMAKAFIRMVSEVMHDNYNYFADAFEY